MRQTVDSRRRGPHRNPRTVVTRDQALADFGEPWIPGFQPLPKSANAMIADSWPRRNREALVWPALGARKVGCGRFWSTHASSVVNLRMHRTFGAQADVICRAHALTEAQAVVGCSVQTATLDLPVVVWRRSGATSAFTGMIRCRKPSP